MTARGWRPEQTIDFGGEPKTKFEHDRSLVFPTKPISQMSVNASTLAKKEHYYTLLAQSIDELSQATVKFQALMDRAVQQHKAMSSMTIWHVAQ